MGFININNFVRRRQYSNGKVAIYTYGKKSNQVRIAFPSHKLKECSFFPGESRVRILWDKDQKRMRLEHDKDGLLLRKDSKFQGSCYFLHRETMSLPTERMESTEKYKSENLCLTQRQEHIRLR